MLSLEGERETADKFIADNASERTYVELAIKRIREEREQRTWSVLDNAITFIQEDRKPFQRVLISPERPPAMLAMRPVDVT